jgi:putative hydrolase of the HAD superfamily
VLVLLDLDNTLADRTIAFDRWAAEFAAAYHLPADARTALVRLDQDGFLDRPDFIAAVKEHFGIDRPAAELLSEYDDRYPHAYRPEPLALAAVDRLHRAGAAVGIVTNGRPSQATKLEVTGLGAAVDGACISSLVGAHKPERAIFEEAARRCGTTLEGGWMVGDSPQADIVGGQDAGLRTVWIHRGREWPADLRRPDAVAGDVTAAVDAILGASD